ncbi:MAG: hypothetical protein ACPGJV_03610, partial [Bacteriovoracaceae bacterium]
KKSYKSKRISVIDTGDLLRRRYARYLADLEICPHFIEPKEDEIRDKLKTLTTINDLNIFRGKKGRQEFATNITNEIFHWLVEKSKDPTRSIDLDDQGNLKGDEFKGDVGALDLMSFYFSRAENKPEKIFVFLRKYIEQGTLKEREAKASRIEAMLVLFTDIIDIENAVTDPNTGKTIIPNGEKYYKLLHELISAVAANDDTDEALNQLSDSVMGLTSNMMKDLVDAQMAGLDISKQDRQTMAQTIDYVIGESDVPTSPPLDRTIEFFPNSSFYGPHLKGTLKECTECALSFEALQSCYVQAYRTLQDPIIEWTLKKVDIRKKTFTETPIESNQIQLTPTMPNVTNRLENYLKTNDFFGSFLRPSTHEFENGNDHERTIDLIAIAKHEFEQTYHAPSPEFSAQTQALLEHAQAENDPLAKSWVEFRDFWANRFSDRKKNIDQETKTSFEKFSQTLTPTINLVDAQELANKNDPYTDKLKLHYATEHTLRFILREAMNLFFEELGLTEEDIKYMEEPLKSKAMETRKVLLEKRLDLFNETIPKIVRERLDEALLKEDSLDSTLLDYVFDYVRTRTIEDGIEIVHDIFKDPHVVEMVDKFSKFKYEQILIEYEIERDSSIASNLEKLLVGTNEDPSLSKQIFGELKNFFFEVKDSAEQNGLQLFDKEMAPIFDASLAKFNKRMHDISFSKENVETYKSLITELYDKYKKQIFERLGININTAHPELRGYLEKIDLLFEKKTADIIEMLKKNSKGQSPLQIIEEFEKNIIEILNEEFFKKDDVKSLLKDLTDSILADYITEYSQFFLSPKNSKIIKEAIKNKRPFESRIDVIRNYLNQIQAYDSGIDLSSSRLLISIDKEINKAFNIFFSKKEEETFEDVVLKLKENFTLQALSALGGGGVKKLSQVATDKSHELYYAQAKSPKFKGSALEKSSFELISHLESTLLSPSAADYASLHFGKLAKPREEKVQSFTESAMSEIGFLTTAENEAFQSFSERLKKTNFAKPEDQRKAKRDFDSLISQLQTLDSIKEENLRSRFDLLIYEASITPKDVLNEVTQVSNTIFFNSPETEPKLINFSKDLINFKIDELKDKIIELSGDSHDSKELINEIENVRLRLLNSTGTTLQETLKLLKEGKYIETFDLIEGFVLDRYNQEVVMNKALGEKLKSWLKGLAAQKLNELPLKEILGDQYDEQMKLLIGDIGNDIDYTYQLIQERNTQEGLTELVDSFEHFFLGSLEKSFQSKKKHSFLGTVAVNSIMPESTQHFKAKSLRFKLEGLPEFQLPDLDEFYEDSKLVFKNITPNYDVNNEFSQESKFYLQTVNLYNYSNLTPLVQNFTDELRFQAFCDEHINRSFQISKEMKQLCVPDNAEDSPYKKHFTGIVHFLRDAKMAPNPKCRETVSNILHSKKIEELFFEASFENSNDSPWDIKNFFNTLIKLTHAERPSLVECFLLKKSSEIHNKLKEQNDLIANNFSKDVYDSMEDLFNPDTITNLFNEKPDLLSNYVDRLVENSNKSPEIPLSDHALAELRNKLIPEVLYSQDVKMKVLNLVTNINLQTPLIANTSSFQRSLAHLSFDVNSEWLETLERDFPLNVSKEEIDELWKLAPQCMEKIATQALTPYQLNAQFFVDNHSNFTKADFDSWADTFCITSKDEQEKEGLQCIRLSQEQKRELRESENLAYILQEGLEFFAELQSNYYYAKEYRINVTPVPSPLGASFCYKGEEEYQVLEFAGDNYDELNDYFKAISEYIEDQFIIKQQLRLLSYSLYDLRRGDYKFAAYFLEQAHKTHETELKTYDDKLGPINSAKLTRRIKELKKCIQSLDKSQE